MTANYEAGTVSVLLGNGNGGFAAKTDFATGVGSLPMSVAVADFNNDGKLDLVTANSWSPTVSVLLGNGHGSFGASHRLRHLCRPRLGRRRRLQRRRQARTW